jgi:hypothetical protein
VFAYKPLQQINQTKGGDVRTPIYSCIVRLNDLGHQKWGGVALNLWDLILSPGGELELIWSRGCTAAELLAYLLVKRNPHTF